MSRASLADVLPRALDEGRAVAGLVVLGWEDARAYVAAAEAEGAPVILQAGPGCRAHTPLPVLAAMFRELAEGAGVPVVTHLDHGADPAECRRALDLGFSSVMYDGSLLPLDDNIAAMAEVAAAARAAGASSEGEVGVVGYAGGAQSRGTDPSEAARFVAETGVDALAVSVGNVHLQTDAATGVDRAQLAAIEAAAGVPLVLHGGSGLDHATRRALARETAVCKINVGTELRQTFGRALRALLDAHPDRYDRIEILRGLEPELTAAARRVIAELWRPGPA